MIANDVAVYLDYRPNNAACTNGQVLKYVTIDSAWKCFDDITGNDGSTSSDNVTLNSNSDGTDGGDIIFQTANSTKMTLADSGTLTVNSATLELGTTAISGANLSITEAIDPATFSIGKDSNEHASFTWNNSDGNEYISIGTKSDTHGDNLDTLIIQNGQLGIGKVPASTLDVLGIIRATSICDESGANCVDLSTGDSDSSNKLPLRGGTMSGNIALSGDGDSEGVFLDGSGNVGIGTTSPSYKLDVQSSSAIGGIKISAANGTMGGFISAFDVAPTNQGITIASNRNEANGSFIDSGAASARIRLHSHASNSSINFDTSTVNSANPLTRMKILNNGNVGIGTTSPSYKLHVAGTIYANGSTISAGATTWSDERFKERVETIDDAMEKIERIEGVSYFWKQDAFEDRQFEDDRQIGVIAQNVEQVFPEAVLEDKDGYLSVNYGALVAPLIEATKEQQVQIEKNMQMFEMMQGKYQELNRRIASLEEENIELKSENRVIKEYLCNKFGDASFCSK